MVHLLFIREECGGGGGLMDIPDVFILLDTCWIPQGNENSRLMVFFFHSQITRLYLFCPGYLQ